MAETTLTRDGEDLVIALGGAEIGRYRVADDSIEPIDTPKPYLHPLRTLGGVLLTDFAPDDHRWHHGLQFAFPRVGEHNLWGGGTYFSPERGYEVVEDQGSLVHEGWTLIDESQGAFQHRVAWLGHGGERLIEERRTYLVGLIEADGSPGWRLELDTELVNVTGDSLDLQTPAQRGRPDGGYGGWFFRFAAGFDAASLTSDGAPVGESGAEGDTFVIDGRTATGEPVTIGMHYGPQASPGSRRWLYRFEPFPLAGFAVAYQDGLTIPPGQSLRFSHRIACLDGQVSPAAVSAALRAE